MARKTVQTIGIVFNLKQPADDDTYEEYDEIETIEALQNEIERLNCTVVRFEDDGRFLQTISAAQLDFVVNIAEGRGSTRGRESQVPCILESLGLPYSGSDPVALGITLDKYLTNTLLRSAGIPVPECYCVRSLKDVKPLAGLFKKGKQFIVKPRWEGSSKGIFLNAVVSSSQELARRAGMILRRYRQPAIVEAFLPGDEITAGVCGNTPPRLLGMMRIRPRQESGGQFIYSLETKKDWEAQIVYEPPQVLSRDLRDRITAYALRVFDVLELRDIARIDFRIGADGVPAVIDVNPLPGLSPRYSDLPILCRLNGISYQKLVRKFLTAALKRCGFSMPVRKSARTEVP